jgi:putative cell wall-binding protein
VTTVAVAALVSPLVAAAPVSATTFDVAISAENTWHYTEAFDVQVDIPMSATSITFVEPSSMAADDLGTLSFGIDSPDTGFSYQGSGSRSGGSMTFDLPATLWSSVGVGETIEVWASSSDDAAGESDGFLLVATAAIGAAGAPTATETLDANVLSEWWATTANLSNVHRGDTISVTATPGWFTSSASGTAELGSPSGSFDAGGPEAPITVSDDGGAVVFDAPDPSRRSAAWRDTDDPTFRLSAEDIDSDREKVVIVQLVLEYADTDPAVNRVSGADRYEAANAIAREAYPDGAPIVFIAAGTKFPDALSAAPVAALRGGPLLITLPDRLPESTRAELERLDPAEIVVVGGINSVGASVFSQLQEMVPDTIRIAGADRYEVARNLIDYGWGETGTDAAYIATGVDFPDALAASAAAGSRGIPVILVYGKSETLDAPTMDMLGDLGVTEPIIAGGPASVSPGIETGLEQLTTSGYVERLFGENRYTASLDIARSAFDTADQVFFATGANFPDALAGAAWAGSVSGPLYTLPGTCVLDGVLKDIDRYHLEKITLLGGPASLSPAVENLSPCGWGDWDESPWGEG